MPAVVAPRRSARAAAAAIKAQSAKAEPPAAKPEPKPKRKAAPKRKVQAAKADAAPAAKKTKRTNLKKAITDTSVPLGVIDPEAKIKGTILSVDGDVCDVMLALVDPAQNTDKFYILQLIENSKKRKKNRFAVYTRWGRTGSKGQALLQEFDDVEEATQCFQDKFKSKNGHTWEDREKPVQGDKYRFIAQNFEQKQSGYSGAKWQYWVEDGVDHKVDGWYDYDADASKIVEQLFHEHSNNQNVGGRSIDSGEYAYDVDLDQMIQTNVKHPNRTQRRIRRCPVGGDLDDAAPEPLPSANPAVPAILSSPKPAAANAMPATPVQPPSSNAATVSPPSPQAPPAAASKKKGGSHPVDPDISVQGYDADNYSVVCDGKGLWYDAVLNQCNIGNNNNKYYRLQCLKDSSGNHYAWFRWGRVGEGARRGASTWSGPHSSFAKAKAEFCKKYKAKSGNAFGAKSFTAYTGKYTLIEIDNDVEVSDEYKTKPRAKEDIVYEASALDGTTKELMEVLFSQDMRNEALSSFNLDLKRLPLGVPSQAQIGHAVDILARIEDKLGGNNTRESYQDLSSEFYTAIPHSFGRTRPPVISSAEALRSRFDMCNILNDMFETNETVRRIEREQAEESVKKTILPNPIDQHYKSLSADMKLVDQKSMEFEIIKKCFLETGGKSSRSQLLNVWAVDRANEAQRFQKFDDVENRHLLWHGTNIAVVAPIITSGLRIMPHSGGRVGSGIYLAGMQAKSAQYTSGYGAKFACMFLCEAPLGKQHPVDSDGYHASSLTKTPAGFNSVHAKGRIQPKKYANMTLDKKTIKVAQGDCTPAPANSSSSFHHDEFLVYEESQVRLRYVLTIKL